MKILNYFLLALIFCNGAFALDKSADIAIIQKSVMDVCLRPSEQGKYWEIAAKGGASANAPIRMIVLGVNGELTFKKGEWEGVQQVLKEHQAGDNESYRRCVEKLTPLLENKSSKTSKNGKNTQIIENITGNQNVIQNESHGDINFSSGK